MRPQLKPVLLLNAYQNCPVDHNMDHHEAMKQFITEQGFLFKELLFYTEDTINPAIHDIKEVDGRSYGVEKCLVVGLGPNQTEDTLRDLADGFKQLFPHAADPFFLNEMRKAELFRSRAEWISGFQCKPVAHPMDYPFFYYCPKTKTFWHLGGEDV